ncbi:Gfo/Idh/MocA family oxidoreductase [Bacillus sp. OTU530]|uniref:Gfo/Idh/MocA family oxidoreductase n=1 Tax=Bacillus sp. OTU530 TaxID=3043862 RepID=UPI00313E93E3
MKNKIRCAAIGVGHLGYLHAENLHQKIDSVEITKVVSSRLETAEKAARKLGISDWTINPDEVFNDPDIDAVIITTPNNTHSQLIKAAARGKKHIFVEKPITQTIEEAHDIVQTIRKNGVFCQVGFMRRFDPAYAEAKRRIEAGDIGKPLYFKGVSRDPDSPPASYIRNSGSIFSDFTIHDYDIARYLIGSEVNSVRAMGGILMNPYLAEFNDLDQAMTYLTFESGAAGDIESSRNAGYGYDIRGEVIGTEGVIQIRSLKHHDIQVLTAKGSTHDIIPEYQSRFKDAFVLEMEHFVGCLIRGVKPSCNELDGLRSLEIAQSARDSFQSNREVSLVHATV